MSGDIIDLSAKRVEKYRHQTGEALCIACGHEWTAVAPVGTVWLECPSCKLEKGGFRGACQPDEPVATCGCGNQLHYVTPTGIHCPNCGNLVSP